MDWLKGHCYWICMYEMSALYCTKEEYNSGGKTEVTVSVVESGTCGTCNFWCYRWGSQAKVLKCRKSRPC